MLIHRVISFLLSALMLLFVYWQLMAGELWLSAVPYFIAALFCLARAFNYSWKYISLSIHIVIVLISFYYLGDVMDWISAGASLDSLKEAGSQLPYIDGTKSFLRLTIAAITMFYQYRIAKH